MTTEAATRNPYREREALRADITRARVSRDTLRGQLARIHVERKQAEADAFKAEMDAVVGVAGATERRDAALERLRGAEGAEREYQRGLEAADAIIKLREGQLAALYDDDEGFVSFCREAEAATAGALSDLQEMRQALAEASSSWSKAASLWRPLNGAIRRRLEELNKEEGAYPNVAPMAAVLPFPVGLPSDLATAAPRPPGIARLRSAEKTG